MPDVPALRRMRQEDLKFEASLDYLGILWFKEKNKKPTKTTAGHGGACL